MSDVVTFEKQGQIGFITLNRPEARNAVNGAVAQAFESALDQLENDPEVWVGILQANFKQIQKVKNDLCFALVQT